MDLGFTESHAVVTGGSKGMGLAIATALAAEGANVAVMARGQDALDAQWTRFALLELLTPSESASTWLTPHPLPKGSPPYPNAGDR